SAIREGVELLSQALPQGAIGMYQIQAAIAAIHDEASRAEDTDWPQVLALYDLLSHVAPGNPMVALNRAIAVAMVHGPQKGLDLLDRLDSEPTLKDHHRLPAVRAHLSELAGDTDRAKELYTLAASRASSLPERHYLLTKAARLDTQKHPR